MPSRGLSDGALRWGLGDQPHSPAPSEVLPALAAVPVQENKTGDSVLWTPASSRLVLTDRHKPCPASSPHDFSFRCCLAEIIFHHFPFSALSAATPALSYAAKLKVTLGRAPWQLVGGCHVLTSCNGARDPHGGCCRARTEPGDLCWNPRGCSGPSCAQRPGPVPVQGRLAALS